MVVSTANLIFTQIFLSCAQLWLRGPFLGHQEQVLHLPVRLGEVQALGGGHRPGAEPPRSPRSLPRAECRFWTDHLGKLLGLFWGLLHVGVFSISLWCFCIHWASWLCVGVWPYSLTGATAASCLRHNYAYGTPRHPSGSFPFHHEIYALVF